MKDAGKHPARPVISLGPDFDALEDEFIESEWMRKGQRGSNSGKNHNFNLDKKIIVCLGEFWNPDKIQKLQDEINKFTVPDNYIPMKVDDCIAVQRRV